MQAAPPLSGSGTQTDPYLITSKADVLALAKYVNGTDDGTTATNNQTKAGGDVCAGLYFAFTADVDMQHDTTFLGIGAVTNFHRTSTTSWKFSGNIDGRGHKISNLTINGMVFKDDGSISTSSNTTTRGSRQYTGFIGILEKGSVTNLHFDASCSVTSYSKVGMVVGRMSQGSTVSGCSSAGTVRSYSDYAGGIVSDCSATSSTTLTVADCQNTGTVYCNYRYAGGITGGLYYGTITNCINTGRIELHSFHSSRAEGVQEGADGNWFGGSYDGRNHSVSNITSQAEATTEVNSHGLFGGVAQGGIVKNLSLKGFNLQANLNGGLLAGTVNGTVSNITTDATSRIAGVKSTVLFTTCKGEHMGGIAGLVNPAGRIENCTNRATVEGLKYAGGIAGYSATTGNPVITGCVNYGTVTGTAPQEYTQTGTSQPTPKPIEVYAGGIAGQLSGTATNCVNHGLVTMSSNNNAVGGIAGSTYSATTIDGCVNYGEVTARNYSAGGIVGETANTTSLKANMIQNCRNYGVISGINRIAGIAGYVKAYNTLKNCANFADLEPKGMRNGGIAGEVSATVSGSDPYAMFENCYNTGAISCNGYGSYFS